jgi:LiaI-LiaF-like transmembrane region
MRATTIKIIWGVILISLGGMSLANQLGYINFDSISEQWAMIFFATLSAAFFLSYFLSGIRKWGWLFPALIFAALALTIHTMLKDPDDSIIAIPILLSIAIPFYAGYFVNRKHWGLLIPAWAFTFLPMIPTLSDRINPDLLGSLVLYSIAIPFLIGYLVDQRRKWALIIATFFGFIGLFPLLNTFIHGDTQGPVVMLLFTLAFILIYSASKKNWWALIPAGFFASIGLVALLNILLPDYGYLMIGNYQIGVYRGVLFLGWAITFGILWLLSASQPTDWAKYPTIGLLVTSMLAVLMGKGFEDFLPAVILLVSGVILIIAQLSKRRINRQPTS